jgi:hypothetical protein
MENILEYGTTPGFLEDTAANYTKRRCAYL